MWRFSELGLSFIKLGEQFSTHLTNFRQAVVDNVIWFISYVHCKNALILLWKSYLSDTMKIYMFVPYFISCCHSSYFKQNTRNHSFGWVSTPSFINAPPFSKIAIHLSHTLAFSFYKKPYHLDCTIKYINIIKCISFIPLYIYIYIYI